MMPHPSSNASTTTLVSAMLGRSPMFSTLSRQEIHALSEVFFPCTLAQGQYLFRQGDMGNFLALLTSGTLGVRLGDDETRNFANTLEPYELIGEMTCLDPAPRSASIVAISNAEVLILERDRVVELRKSAPETYSALLRCIWQRVSTRLRVTNEAIGLYGSANDQVAFQRQGEAPRSSSYRGEVSVEAIERVNHFTRREVEILYSIATKKLYPAGACICREGDLPHVCYIIARGTAKVYRDQGRERYELGALSEGALFGQVALLEHRRRSATILAETDCVVVELNRQDFDRLVHSSSPFALRFQEMVTVNGIRQLRLANRRYAS